MDSMEKLSVHLRNRPAELRRLREEGTKVVGYFVGDYVPEEIIYASGAVPICLVHGGDTRAVDAALVATTRFLCPFARAQYGERVLKEQPYYNLVDMLIAPLTCQHLRRAADLWDYHTDVEVLRIGIPHEYDSGHGLKYYIEMLKLMKEKLEKFTGNEIKEEKLQQAIGIYNSMREFLKEISMLRKAPQLPISTLDFIRLNHASFYADPTFMVEVLDSLRKELSQREKGTAEQDKPRILLVGPIVAYGDYQVLEFVEEAGGLIVAEELCEGVRYYWQGVETNGDLVVALANKYLKERMPCAFMRSSAKKRFDFIMNLAKEFKVAGIIWYQLLYCETYDMESYYFVQKMQDEGMPVLKLDSDYSVSDRGPFRTRIETFVETLKERR